jgi:hypothetical protein
MTNETVRQSDRECAIRVLIIPHLPHREITTDRVIEWQNRQAAALIAAHVALAVAPWVEMVERLMFELDAHNTVRCEGSKGMLSEVTGQLIDAAHALLAASEGRKDDPNA